MAGEGAGPRSGPSPSECHPARKIRLTRSRLVSPNRRGGSCKDPTQAIMAAHLLTYSSEEMPFREPKVARGHLEWDTEPNERTRSILVGRSRRIPSPLWAGTYNGGEPSPLAGGVSEDGDPDVAGEGLRVRDWGASRRRRIRGGVNEAHLRDPELRKVITSSLRPAFVTMSPPANNSARARVALASA